MSERFYTLKVPPTFFYDHEARGLVQYSGTEYIVKKTKSSLVVRLSERDALDLIGDADYYSTEWVYMGNEFFGLGRSAVATLKSVKKQMTEQGYNNTEDAKVSEAEAQADRLLYGGARQPW